MGIGEAKELTCTTRGHELRWRGGGNAGGKGGPRERGSKVEKLGQL